VLLPTPPFGLAIKNTGMAASLPPLQGEGWEGIGCAVVFAPSPSQPPP